MSKAALIVVLGALTAGCITKFYNRSQQKCSFFDNFFIVQPYFTSRRGAGEYNPVSTVVVNSLTTAADWFQHEEMQDIFVAAVNLIAIYWLLKTVVCITLALLWPMTIAALLMSASYFCEQMMTEGHWADLRRLVRRHLIRMADAIDDG